MKVATRLAASAALIGASVAQLTLPPVAYGPAPTGCAPYEIVIARGTGEEGPFGFIVGDPLVKNVQAVLPGARGYAVQYPADIGADTLPIGAKDIRNRLETKSKECPNMKYVLSGYSQGGYVVRDGLSNVTDPNVLDKIVGVVMFGDPGISVKAIAKSVNGSDPSLRPLPKKLYGELREFCAPHDPVCGGDGTFVDHLQYREPAWAKAAATYVINAFKGTPFPPDYTGELHNGTATGNYA